jgi:hypothetical protein
MAIWQGGLPIAPVLGYIGVIILSDSTRVIWLYTGGSMFDSLADRMKQDQAQEVNATERAIRLVAVIVLSAAVFGGLYYVVRLLG